MATLTERLQYILSADNDQFVGSMTKAGTVAEKELGKAEASLDKVGGNLTKFGVGAMAASAVAGGALLKTAMSFSELGVEVGKFSDLSGFSAETSSRMIEVLGDLGIEVGKGEAALNKMNVTAGKSPELFDKYNVEIAKTKDGNTDAEQTFYNVIDGINGIKDPALKAEAAQALLGRGWTSMAELIKGGSSTLTTSMAAVADAKVFDEGKVQEAKDFRADMDALKDSLEELALSIGRGVAPVIGGLAEGIGKVVSGFSSANEVTGGFLGKALAIGTVAVGAVGALSAIAGQAIKMRDNLGKGVEMLGKLGPAVAGAAGLAGLFVYAYANQETQADRSAEATKRFTEALKAQSEGAKDAVLQQIASDLQAGSFLSTMEKLGLTVGDVADVIQGKSVPAYDKTRTTLEGLLNTAIVPTDQAVLKLGDQFGIGVGEAQGFLDRIVVLTSGLQGAKDATAIAKKVTEDLGIATTDAGDAAEGATPKLYTFGMTMGGAGLQASAAAESLHAVETATAQADAAYSLFMGNLDERKAWRNAQEAMWNFRGEAEHTQASTDTAAEALGRYTQSAKDIPPEIKSRIYAELDQGSVDEAYRILEELRKTRFARIIASVGNSAALNDAVHGSGKAAGGRVEPYSIQPVNEQGPEGLTIDGQDYLMMGSKGGDVVPNNKLRPSARGLNIGVLNVNNYTDEAGLLQRLQFAMAGG